jgi:D-glycero-D-manno-heptose 1,7-bisphosphate phosphatase
MSKAVFLDRDGVINRLVYNPNTNEYEAPQNSNDLELFEWSLQALELLYKKDYKLFLVSNQPDYAKGKTTLKSLKAVHDKLHKYFVNNGLIFKEYFYCYHHPEGVIPEYTKKCKCRKPNPFYVLKAIKNYHIDKNESWFIGDRDSDILCGQASGLTTVLINNEHSKSKSRKSKPDFRAGNLLKAVQIIINK